jgi:hypothetical protein
MPQSRRQFVILLLSASSLAPVWSGSASLAAAIEPASRHAAKLVTRFFGHPESARIVGAAYLGTRPDQVDVGGLLSDLFPSAACGARGGPESTRDFCIEFDERRRLDFESGRVVSIAGWVLSETEAKLCALAALS